MKLRLLKDYSRIDQEKKAALRAPDPGVKIRKRSTILNRDKTLNVDVSDDTEKEVLFRINSIYKRDFVRSNLDWKKSPDFIIDKIYEECARRGKKTTFISIDRSFNESGFRVTIKYDLSQKENLSISKSAMKLKVALLLLLEEIIS